MKYIVCNSFIFILVFLLSFETSSRQISSVQDQSPSNTDQSKEYPGQAYEFVFTNETKISYNGYEMVKLNRVATDEKTGHHPAEISYLVVKSNGKAVARFDSVYFGVGNATDFGLFPLLGKEKKQLMVSQTIPRSGRHWVADLSDEFLILFDSDDYGVGREEFGIIDIDKDGVFELSLPVTAFYLVFGQLSMYETPLPEVVFKYDEKARKYYPANHLFQNYALREVEDRIKKLKPPARREYLSDRLNILLDYLYAGKEEEGWAFFYNEYNLPDIDEVVSKTKAVLKEQPAYIYIASQSSK